VKTNKTGSMIPEELDQALTKAKAEGKTPFFVNSTAGTTVLGAFDDFERIADVCEKHDVWMHIDVRSL
jgi:glutamate/tyrosine decarboxylase-like PLP-dependent enzyme